MSRPQLIYYANPMCSWCWGFSPVISAIQAQYAGQTDIRLVTGGLRLGSDNRLNQQTSQAMRRHWEKIQGLTGQPFDYGFFDRTAYDYDTEPACRALMVLRQAQVADELDLLRCFQQAFYAENRDLTCVEVLSALAKSMGMSEAQFKADYESGRIREATWAEFDQAQDAGVFGYPTLIGRPANGGKPVMISNGFQDREQVLPILMEWLEAQAG